MISATDRMYYIDPVQDPAYTTKELLILREYTPRSYQSPLGKIVTPEGERMFEAGVLWERYDGLWATGAFLNSEGLSSRQDVMGILSDDLFIIGESYGTIYSGTRMLFVDAVRSDGKVLPGMTSGQQYVAPKWVKAAPWARELMPAAGDTPEVVALKVAIAKERFKRRTAEAQMLREAAQREWEENLQELPDHGYPDMPTASFGAYVNATMLVRTQSVVAMEELHTGAKNALERIQTNAVKARRHAGTPTAVPTRFEVQADFIVPTALASREDVENLDHTSIAQSAAVRLGVYDALLAAFTAAPILRSIS